MKTVVTDCISFTVYLLVYLLHKGVHHYSILVDVAQIQATKRKPFCSLCCLRHWETESHVFCPSKSPMCNFCRSVS